MNRKNVNNQTLVERRNEACPQGLPSKSGIYAARARGAELWDIDDNRYIDFIGGIGVLNVGHCHPKVVDAINSQTEQFIHTCFGIAQYENYIKLCERLNELVPGSSPKKTALFNSGAESIENAVKFSRKISKRAGIISFDGAFHGRTLLTSSLCGKSKPYKDGFGPFSPGIYQSIFPNDKDISVEQALNHLNFLFKASISPDEVAAIIIEPVQGEGGFNPAPKLFLQELRKICDKHGIFLIIDEIQSGFCRTGKMFAHEHYAIEADFVCMAKSLAAGLPLSALTGKAELMDKMPAGSMGSTYGGNPVACAAALAVIDILEGEELAEKANEIGLYVTNRWEEMKTSFAGDYIKEIRSLGAMTALELQDKDGNPGTDLVAKFLVKARELGLITTMSGSYGQVIRTLIPLVISKELLKEGMNIFEQALKETLADGN